MKQGLLYPLINFLVESFNHLNVVEFFKWSGRKANPHKNDKDIERAFERWAVDIFIVIKWAFLLIIWYLHKTNILCTVIVWYLIATNLYTYFYRHIWCEDAINPNSPRYTERVRRRFYNLFLAFSYSNICFAYLYRLPYVSEYTWGAENDCNGMHSIWFSVSNSIAANYNYVTPLTDLGNTVSMLQLVITFIFVTIIIGKSN